MLQHEGFNDWSHISVKLKEHENSADHITNMVTWKEMRLRFGKNQTIDKVALRGLEKEKDHWRKVLLRIILMINFLRSIIWLFVAVIANCTKLTMGIVWAWLK